MSRGSNQILINSTLGNFLPSFKLNRFIVSSPETNLTVPSTKTRIVPWNDISPNNNSLEYEITNPPFDPPQNPPVGAITIKQQGMYSVTTSIPFQDLTGSSQIVNISLGIGLISDDLNILTYKNTYVPIGSSYLVYATCSWTGFLAIGNQLIVFVNNNSETHDVVIPVSTGNDRSSLYLQKIA